MIKPRGGTAAFHIEIERWQGVERNERTCKECQSKEVEDVCKNQWEGGRGEQVFQVKKTCGVRGARELELLASNFLMYVQ